MNGITPLNGYLGSQGYESLKIRPPGSAHTQLYGFFCAGTLKVWDGLRRAAGEPEMAMATWWFIQRIVSSLCPLFFNIYKWDKYGSSTHDWGYNLYLGWTTTYWYMSTKRPQLYRYNLDYKWFAGIYLDSLGDQQLWSPMLLLQGGAPGCFHAKLVHITPKTRLDGTYS